MQEKNIINTNIRLDLNREADRKAWAYLQAMDRKRYKSYSRAVVTAINELFDRNAALAKDPYVETRVKEDAFLSKVLATIEKGAKESMPVVLAASLFQAFQPGAIAAISGSQAVPASATPQNSAEDEQAAMDFLNGF
ncbi:MAG: hypothetical protein LKJ90_04080 [Faecalibacterium sp.]|jgi:hypothetical protein|nr:hypothetical protein [Faecalibacterium sp.]